MKFLKEFKEFIAQGNVMELAIGVIIGGAFGKIVTSFVNDIIMPFIGLILGGNSVSSLHTVLKQGSTPETTITLNYGMFLQNVIDFIIIALVIFSVIKMMMALKKNQEKEQEEEISEEVLLLREIRDSLKNN